MALYFWWVFLLASLQFESVEPNRALNRLNKQFNLLRKTVERDIDDLRYEVTDLQTRLELETDRASKFEALFNASAGAQWEFSLPDLTGQISDTQDLREKYSTLEKEVESLKKENAKLRKLQHVVGNEISEAKQAIKKINDSTTQFMDANGNNIKTFTDLENDVRKLGDDLKDSVQETVVIVTQAFQAEKKELRDFQEELLKENERQGQWDLESEVEKILNGSIQTELDSVQEALDEVRNITDVLTDNIDDVREDIDAMSRKITTNKNKLVELAGCCKNVKQASVVPGTTPAPVVPVTLAPNRNYTVYAVFREDLAKNIRTGSRVIRGKDWGWGNQDGGGPGTVVGWYRNDPDSKEVVVLWDAGRQVNYRVGALDLYDLYLITGGDADHLAGTSTLRFKPIFKASLEAAIAIGSRVIRGEDWAWRDQDGGGPGTVTDWYNSDKSTRQVMVDWDLGTKANYRVGAHGKYDLFLLDE